jgi:hypothetical protein
MAEHQMPLCAKWIRFFYCFWHAWHGFNIHILVQGTEVLTFSKEVFEVPSGLILRILQNRRTGRPKYL